MKVINLTLTAFLIMLAACSGENAIQDDSPIETPTEQSVWLSSFDEQFQDAYNSGKVWECTGVVLGQNDVIRAINAPDWNAFALSINPEAEEFIVYTSTSQANYATTTRFFSHDVLYHQVDTVWGRWSFTDRLTNWPFDNASGFMRRFHKDGYFLAKVAGTTDYVCTKQDYSLATVTGNLISQTGI